MSSWWNEKTPVKNWAIFLLVCIEFWAVINLIYMIAHIIYLYTR